MVVQRHDGPTTAGAGATRAVPPTPYALVLVLLSALLIVATFTFAFVDLAVLIRVPAHLRLIIDLNPTHSAHAAMHTVVHVCDVVVDVIAGSHLVDLLAVDEHAAARTGDVAVGALAAGCRQAKIYKCREVPPHAAIGKIHKTQPKLIHSIGQVFSTKDQHKAYDRVSWAVKQQVLKAMNLPDNFTQLTALLYTDCQTRMKVNGHVGDPHQTFNGVRQACG